MTSPRTALLVSPAELKDLLNGAAAPIVLDVRWRMGDPDGDGRRRFEQAHIPGSVHADIETVFTGHTTDPTEGRHPLPDPQLLAAALAQLGVSPDHDVVVVDEPGSFAAERA